MVSRIVWREVLLIWQKIRKNLEPSMHTYGIYLNFFSRPCRWNSIVLYCFVLYCIVLCCIVYYAILFYAWLPYQGLWSYTMLSNVMSYLALLCYVNYAKYILCHDSGARGAPWVSKFGIKPLSRKILLLTSAYARTDSGGGWGESQDNPTGGGRMSSFFL